MATFRAKIVIDVLPNIGTGKTINISGPGGVIDGNGAINDLGEPGRADGIFRVVEGWLNLKNLTLGIGPSGNTQVSVLTPGKGESAALAFRAQAVNEKPVPVLAGALLSGWTLYVNGSDFAAGAQVRVNGVARATTFVNSYQLKINWQKKPALPLPTSDL
jgi:hypothetical protein